jgi:hypothetical protein
MVPECKTTPQQISFVVGITFDESAKEEELANSRGENSNRYVKAGATKLLLGKELACAIQNGANGLRAGTGSGR